MIVATSPPVREGTAYPAALRREANIGSPMSRRRSEVIRASLLGTDDGFVRCPCTLRAGLEFADGVDPVAAIHDILAEEGYDSPDDLRARFPLPPRRLICRPGSLAGRVRVGGPTRPAVILHQALLLGLCSTSVFDPARPVLWTRASLTRAVELFDPTGFYA